MSKIAEIETMLTAAMRARDTQRVSTLRLVLSALRKGEKDLLRELSEEEEMQILQRERKQRVEAAEAYAEAGRVEQAAAESAELALIDELMPPRLDEAEVTTLVDQAIAATGASSPGEMGRVMSELMPQVAGRADGALVSRLVRERLT
jgi:uncharacterized protein YqeY